MDYPKSIPGVGLVNGGFVDENPLAGSPGSLIPAAWGNSVTQEILNAIKAAGLTPDEARTDQLATAIGALVDFTKLKNTPTTLAGYGITDAVGRLLAVRQIETVGITVYKPNPRAKRIRVRLVGAGLLYLAILRRSGLIRRVAMAVITLVIVKVFVLDVAGLNGLIRVASLLGLGLSLAGLAWLNRWAGQVSREGATPAALEPSRPEPPSGQ